MYNNSLYCDQGTVLCRNGLSRVFAGTGLQANQVYNMKKEMVLNEKVYRSIPGDNLLEMPSHVLFVDNEHAEIGMLTFLLIMIFDDEMKKEIENGLFIELRGENEVKEMLRKYVANEEYVAFAADKLHVGGNMKWE